MKLSKARSKLYKAARLLGDVQAVSSGRSEKMVRRVGRRAAGRAAGKGMRKIFK